MASIRLFAFCRISSALVCSRLRGPVLSSQLAEFGLFDSGQKRQQGPTCRGNRFTTQSAHQGLLWAKGNQAMRLGERFLKPAQGGLLRINAAGFCDLSERGHRKILIEKPTFRAESLLSSRLFRPALLDSPSIFYFGRQVPQLAKTQRSDNVGICSLSLTVGSPV